MQFIEPPWQSHSVGFLGIHAAAGATAGDWFGRSGAGQEALNGDARVVDVQVALLGDEKLN